MNNIKLRNALIIGLTAVLAWRVLSLGLADHLAVEKPGAALFWRSGHPEALFRMAEKSVSRKQWPEAREYALKALKANKLDGRALRVLGGFPNIRATKSVPPSCSTKRWLCRHAMSPVMSGCSSMRCASGRPSRLPCIWMPYCAFHPSWRTCFCRRRRLWRSIPLPRAR